MSTKVVVQGGFTTSQRLLEPLADALCKRFDFADADIVTFPEGIENPTQLERKAKGGVIVPLSAGMLVVARCTGMERVVACNAPEPIAGTSRLIRAAKATGRAVVKTHNLYSQAKTGPHREGAASVIKDNQAQAIRYFGIHARQIDPTSRFSATRSLQAMQSEGIRVARIDTADDEFWGPYPLQPWDETSRRAVLPGCHDQALIDPRGFVSQLPVEAFSS